MKTLNIGIEMDQGADFSLTIGVYAEGGPVDLTGYSFKGDMGRHTKQWPDEEAPGEEPDEDEDENEEQEHEEPEATDPVASFSFAIQDQSTSKGHVVMSLPRATVEAIQTSVASPLVNGRLSTPFLFDVKMKDTAGKVTRIIQGLVFLSPQATEEAFT